MSAECDQKGNSQCPYHHQPHHILYALRCSRATLSDRRPPLWFAASGASDDVSDAMVDEDAAVLRLIGGLHEGGNIFCYCTLNNTSSTRPNEHGGRNVNSVGQRRNLAPAANGGQTCIVELPYQPDQPQSQPYSPPNSTRPAPKETIPAQVNQTRPKTHRSAQK